MVPEMMGLGKIALGLALLLLGLAIYMHFSVNFWGDQDWELLVAHMWLEGKKLYIDHVPVTAPLLFYLYALPVILSRYLPFLQDYQALVLLSLITAVMMIAISCKLMTQHSGFISTRMKISFIVLLAFLLVFRIPPVFFGDREYLLIVLTLPYLFRWMPGLNSTQLTLRMRLLIGAMAAVGFFVKPHCLLLFAAIQFAHILQSRSLRILRSPENITIYGLGILYGIIIWLYTPEYFTLILPLAYFTYSAISGDPGGMYELMLCALFTFIMWRPSDRSPYRKDIYYFTLLLPFYYLYARLNNGWGYAYQPLITGLLLTNGFMLWEFLYVRRMLATTAWRPALGAALCVLNFAMETALMLDYSYDVLSLPCRGDSACPGYYQPFLNEIKIQPPPHSFGTIGLDFALWTRVAKLSGAQWSTRFPQLWMMPKLYIADDTFYNAHLGIFYYVGNALAEDIEQNKPELIFVEVSSLLYSIRMRDPINWVKDFSTIPDFKKAWKHYIYMHSINNCAHFQPSVEAAIKQPKGPGTELKIENLNCHYDVYRRIP